MTATKTISGGLALAGTSLSVSFLCGLLLCAMFSGVQAAYTAHGNDRDTGNVLSVYPYLKGGRLDSCVLCHPTGVVAGKYGKKRHVDACTYCHDRHGLDPVGAGPVPLNPYGKAYLEAGRNKAAVRTISLGDHDGDKVSTWREIMRGTFPGDPGDYPGLSLAPSITLSAADIRRLPRRTFSILMNTHKSGDYYAVYSGVSVEDLLRRAGMSGKASRITVFSPDGYHLTIPLRAKDDFHIIGSYPKSRFYPGIPWVEYPEDFSFPRGALLPGEPCALLAYERSGRPLPESSLVLKKTKRNRRLWILSAEGPFRLVLPQPAASPPDQPQNDSRPSRPYPFNEKWFHNGGSSVRAVVAIRVEPLPEGTTDVDWLRDGWANVRARRIVIYGAIDPDGVR